jgi:hypothetical protein
LSAALERLRGHLSARQRDWLAATAFATFFLAAVIRAVVYAGLMAYGYRIAAPAGYSRVTLVFLVLLFAAVIQVLFARPGGRWPKLLNWFIGIWVGYWVWGLALNVFGFETPLVRGLLADQIHPATWGLPLVLLLCWWLRPSGLDVRRGVDLALGVVLLLIFVRIGSSLFLPESQDLFSWKLGFGWLGLPWEGPQPLFMDDNGPNWFAAYHWSVYGVSIRPSFIFEHANTFGFVAAFGLVYGITRVGRLGLIFSIVFGLLLVSSTSNTSVVAAAAGVGLFLLIKLFQQTRIKWLRGLMVLGLALASAVVLWRVSFDSFNFMGRRSLWELALQTIDLQVLTGVGGQVWQADVVEGSSVGDELHNSFLSALAWGGLLGLMLLVALWALACTAAVQAVHRGNLASACLLTTCLVLSMTESTFAYRYWSMGNALLLAAVLLSQWQPPSRPKGLPTVPGAQTAGLQGAPARRPR